ncbi:MAG: hypothetical protein NDJ92_00820 [Thermoanaerobaculia bacterium]|nr:hypothetical protein [Thermoanaerobaculia bacterium]
MNYVASALVAQLDAETRMRLRSAATAIAVLAMFAIAFTYIPDPSSNRVSISWEHDGKLMSGLYTSSYIGWVVGMLTSMLLPFVGFYLVTGSVKRDIERRIWPIVGATPTPRIAYLAGKLLSSFAYLMLLAAISLIPATFLFFRYGHGPFRPVDMITPWLLLVPPSLLFTAAMALLFDVTPGLRGRGGYVVWFFAWTMLFFMIPGQLAGLLDKDRKELENPAFDPAGIVMVEKAVQQTIASRPKSLNLGIGIVSRPIQRIDFPGVPVTAELAALRGAQGLWSVGVLALATVVFPLGAARSARRFSRRRKNGDELREATAEPSLGDIHVRLVTRESRPSFARSVLADVQLLWQTASWLKWPMAGASLLTLVLPARGSSACTAIVLILSAIVISEAAAREALAGTSSLVFAQPGVPRSTVAWKAASVSVFVLAILLSTLTRAALAGPDRFAAIVLGAVFVVSASVGLGWLTQGGKFFSALFTAVWYVAVQGQLDFTGVFAIVPDLTLCASFAGAGLLVLGIAWAQERRRAR